MSEKKTWCLYRSATMANHIGSVKSSNDNSKKATTENELRVHETEIKKITN